MLVSDCGQVVFSSMPQEIECESNLHCDITVCTVKAAYEGHIGTIKMSYINGIVL